MSKMCESCGMPMKNDPQGGGTNADGTRSENYCSYCWADGRFTFEGTLPQFRDWCYKMMLAEGKPRFQSWIYTRMGYLAGVTGGLPRWKKAK